MFYRQARKRSEKLFSFWEPGGAQKLIGKLKKKVFFLVLLTQRTQFIEGTRGSRFTGYVSGGDDGATTTFMVFHFL